MTRGAVKRLLPRIAVAAMLVIATSPSWRLLLLGASPTADEILQLRCTAAQRWLAEPVARSRPGQVIDAIDRRRPDGLQ
jgi:hypothetical protein